LDLSLDKMRKPYTYHLILLVLYFGSFSLLFSCKATKNGMQTNNTIALNELEVLLQQKEYRIDIYTIYPFNNAATTQVMNALLLQNTGNSASRIDVRGDGNFLELQDSTATSYLPFFGEQRMRTGNYGGTDSAIQFEGIIDDYTIKPYKNKDAFIIEFSVNQKSHSTESFDVSIIVFLNKNVDITLMSSHRNSIRYQGQLISTQNIEE